MNGRYMQGNRPGQQRSHRERSRYEGRYGDESRPWDRDEDYPGRGSYQGSGSRWSGDDFDDDYSVDRPQPGFRSGRYESQGRGGGMRDYGGREDRDFPRGGSADDYVPHNIGERWQGGSGGGSAWASGSRGGYGGRDEYGGGNYGEGRRGGDYGGSQGGGDYYGGGSYQRAGGGAGGWGGGSSGASYGPGGSVGSNWGTSSGRYGQGYGQGGRYADRPLYGDDRAAPGGSFGGWETDQDEYAQDWRSGRSSSGGSTWSGGYLGRGSSEQPWSGRGDFRGRGPKGYQRSDERLKEMLCETLMDDPEIDAGEVTIEVKEGVVMLEGEVCDRQTKYRIEDLCERHGAKDVENRLRITRGQGGEGMRSASSGGFMGMGGHESPRAGMGSTGGSSGSASGMGNTPGSESQRNVTGGTGGSMGATGSQGTHGTGAASTGYGTQTSAAGTDEQSSSGSTSGSSRRKS